MKTHTRLKYLSVLAAAAALSFTPAQAAKSLSGDMCTFKTSNAVYGGGPPEQLSFTWSRSTGKVSEFYWNHGGAIWYSYKADPGTVMAEGPHGYYHLGNLGVTTAGFDSTRYSFKGYIAINVDWPDATLAMIYEGTGTATLVASGKVDCS